MPTIIHQKRVLDVRADPFDIRDRLYNPQLIPLPSQAPSDRWVEAILPLYGRKHVLDQGENGACTGFGLAAVVSHLLFRARYSDLNSNTPIEGNGNDPDCVSPWMLYRHAQLYDEWHGEHYNGSSCRGAMKGWHKHGVCHKRYWQSREIGSNDVGDNVFTVGEECKIVHREGDTWANRIRWNDPAPVPVWQVDALKRPLGAYYRIEKSELRDIQSAIHQVGAVYVSARIHSGWFEFSNYQSTSAESFRGFPVIPFRESRVGGHAFALIGYNERGFLVQNSWGKRWGQGGFAILTYEDWTLHGVDCWIATLGAPVAVEVLKRDNGSHADESGDSMPRERYARGGYRLFGGESLTSINTRSIDSRSLDGTRVLATRWNTRGDEKHDVTVADPSWVERVAIRAGYDGRAIPTISCRQQGSKHVAETMFDRPLAALANYQTPRVILYFDGCLETPAEIGKRVQVFSPLFDANELYPLFFSWSSGIQDSFHRVANDALRALRDRNDGDAIELFDKSRKQSQERVARYIESFCRRVGLKALWTEMKQSIRMSANPGGALHAMSENLKRLSLEFDGQLEVHLAAQSAGSIPAGELLRLLGKGRRRVQVKTCTLWAPACTLSFANRRYIKALNTNRLRKLEVAVLSDELERRDNVARLYNRSCLYLISRALERRHKEPLLGFQKVWESAQARWDELDLWYEPIREDASRINSSELPPEFDRFQQARESLGDRIRLNVRETPRYFVSINPTEDANQPLQPVGQEDDRNHTSFERDVELFNHLIHFSTGREPICPAQRLSF